MIRIDRPARGHLAASIALTLSGITCAIYGSDSIGGLATVIGILYLGLSIHRFGRLGADT